MTDSELIKMIFLQDYFNIGGDDMNELKTKFDAIERELKRLEQILNHDDDTSEYWNNIDRVNAERANIIEQAKQAGVQLFD